MKAFLEVNLAEEKKSSKKNLRCLLKNDHRSVIDFTFKFDMVFYMVAISTCNKGNG